MKTFLAFITALFSFFPKPPIPIIPLPTPIIFHPYPASNISVNWGSLAPNFTIFMEPDMKPCDHLERAVTITNNGSASKPLTIKGSKTSEEKSFSQILDIKIFKDNVLIYGPKKLKDFFVDSASPTGVSLGNLSGNSTSAYKIVVDFPCSAGNEYQQAKLVFKLKIGKLLPLPQPCPCSCYKNHDGEHRITSRDKNVYADFDEGEKVQCPNRFSCATITTY